MTPLRRRLALALLLLVLGWLAFAWRADEAARGEPIRVAFAGPVSGPSARDGLSAVRAIELVFARTNAEGGVAGRPLVLELHDDANDPQRARENAPRIADDPDIVAVVGHHFSTCSIAAGPLYAERGLPAVTAAATSVAVTRDNPWYFRVVYNDRAQGRLLVAYLRHVLGAERFAIIHGEETYGAFLAEVMQAAAPQAGLPAPRTWSFDPSDPALDARLARIAREVGAGEAPPVLVLAMQPGPGVRLVKLLRDSDFAGQIVATDALASQAFVEGFRAFPAERVRPGFYTEGILVSTPFLFDTAGRRASAFVSDYLERHDASPDWYAAFAADAAGALVEALRRGEISPTPGSIAADRARLRDALASIDAFRSMEGVTGPLAFDANGDAEKPVPMGRFEGGEVVSAFAQLEPVPQLRDPSEAEAWRDAGSWVAFGDRVLARTEVARVGVMAHQFRAIDFDAGSFELDFNLWFRHEGDTSIEDVEFTNAIGEIELGSPVDEVVEDGRMYRLYRVQGRFRTDSVPAAYGRHSLGLSLHHRGRTRDDLVLAVDSVGMGLGRERTRQQRSARARRLVSANSGWTVENVFFFEDEADEPGLGHPRYLGTGSGRPFSQLTLGVVVRRQTSSLREVLPQSWQRPLLLTSVFGSLGLLLVPGARGAGLRFVLQLLFGLGALLAAEPLLGNWLRARAEPHQLALLSRAFDLLWWVVPAVFVTLAIDRFVWRPAEERSGRPIPTLLRWFVASIVYLLAFFGAVAFVYDYRLTGLLATSGMVAMIVGLAVQLNITNLFAGVALNLERPFRVGDWIMIHGRTPDPDNGVIGQVVDINWRTTRLRTADDTEIVIPNGQISEKTITNFMHPTEASRFELYYTIDHSVPFERVLSVIQQALDAVTGPGQGGPVADPAPKVRIRKVTDTGVEYLVRYHLMPSQVSPTRGRHRVNESVLRHLREAGIELAYPKRRVFEQRPARVGDD